jgi:hypothetical protein
MIHGSNEAHDPAAAAGDQPPYLAAVLPAAGEQCRERKRDISLAKRPGFAWMQPRLFPTMPAKRFRIAFSFAGEKRVFVKQVAKREPWTRGGACLP